MGFEPTTPGTTIQCSNQLSYIHHILGTNVPYFFPTMLFSPIPIPIGIGAELLCPPKLQRRWASTISRQNHLIEDLVLHSLWRRRTKINIFFNYNKRLFDFFLRKNLAALSCFKYRKISTFSGEISLPYDHT